ncbi:cutinase family protein [Nocardia iowensis]|uniref:Cutinase family protein n=1 Tax=Nocardia iowensis TaxID=204891 RepID=A0ABX8RFL0_NOCIO|nr:cutinase family protein [Nocardia iowensis]QXN88403.1 cutinase family protein [Nocardia iowensis]
MFSRWKNTAACAAAMVTAVLPVGTASTAQAAPQHCPEMYVVAIPGTWETSNTDPGKGMLAEVAEDLPGDVWTDYVAYPATAFPWEGDVYGRSKQEAIDDARGLITAMAQRCDTTRFALLGYSQGADAAGDLAAEIGTGLGAVSPNRVALVGLISDPRRSPTDTLIGPPVTGAGAGGPRLGGFGWLSPQTYTFCAAGDLYCATPDGDFAARIAGFFAQISNPNPDLFGSYQRQADELINDALAAGGLGLLADQLNNSAYEERKRQIDDFLKSGIHQSYPGYAVGGGATPLTWLRQRLIEATRG